MRLLTLIALAACHRESAPPVAPAPLAQLATPADAAPPSPPDAAPPEPPPPPPLPGARLVLDAGPAGPHLALAWSPDGAELASREVRGRIDLWKGVTRASTIDARRGSFVWWRGGGLVGDAFDKGRPRLRVWTGARVADERTNLAVDHAAATVSGEIALLAARWEPPPQANAAARSEVPMLALDVRGAISELPIPDAATSNLLAVAISPDGKRGVAIRVIGEDSSLLLVDVDKRTVTPSDVRADAVAISNAQIAIARHTEVLQIDGSTIATRISPISHLAYAPDGARLAIASRDGTIQIVGGAEWRGDGTAIAAIAWSPDGAQLAIATELATYLWSAR